MQVDKQVDLECLKRSVPTVCESIDTTSFSSPLVSNVRGFFNPRPLHLAVAFASPPKGDLFCTELASAERRQQKPPTPRRASSNSVGVGDRAAVLTNKTTENPLATDHHQPLGRAVCKRDP